MVTKCLTCQRVKVKHQKPTGSLQPLKILKWKQEIISLDFIVGLLRTRVGHDSIQVIMDKLTKSAHFMPIKINFSLERLAYIYIQEISLPPSSQPETKGSLLDSRSHYKRHLGQNFTSVLHTTRKWVVRLRRPYKHWMTC